MDLTPKIIIIQVTVKNYTLDMISNPCEPNLKIQKRVFYYFFVETVRTTSGSLFNAEVILIGGLDEVRLAALLVVACS